MMDDTVYDGMSLPPSGEVTEPPAAPSDLEVPTGSREEQLAWVGSAESAEDRSARATALWESVSAEEQTGELSGQLMGAVYQQPSQEPETVTPDLPTVEDAAEADAGAGVATGGDGPSYEEAAASGPDADTVTAEPEAVAASPDSPAPTDPSAAAAEPDLPGQATEPAEQAAEAEQQTPPASTD